MCQVISLCAKKERSYRCLVNDMVIGRAKPGLAELAGEVIACNEIGDDYNPPEWVFGQRDLDFVIRETREETQSVTTRQLLVEFRALLMSGVRKKESAKKLLARFERSIEKNWMKIIRGELVGGA